MEALVKEVLQKAGIVVGPTVLIAIVACVSLKCVFTNNDCIDIVKECIEEFIGIKI